MADIVKEIYNGTVLFGNYTAGVQNLATTNANTTLVVKDVEIGTNTYTTAPNLQVSGFNVGTLSGNLSGSEIIGTNSALQIKSDESFFGKNTALSYVRDVSTTPVYYPATTPSTFVAPSTTTATVTQGSGTTGSSFNGKPNWGYQIGSDYYYFRFDGNSTTILYRRNGGITGNDTAIWNDSYTPYCFDGVDNIYWIDSSSYLRKYNATTNTTTAVNYNPSYGSGTTYPAIWFANGLVFWLRTTGDQVKVIDAATGNILVTTNNTWAISSNTYGATAFYDSTTFKYRLMIQSDGYSSTVQYFDIQSNASNTSFTTSLPGQSASWTLNGSGIGIRVQQTIPATTTNLVFGTGNSGTASTVYSINMNNFAISPTAIVTNAAFTSDTRGQATLTNLTTQQLNDNGPRISLRITGVESTI